MSSLVIESDEGFLGHAGKDLVTDFFPVDVGEYLGGQPADCLGRGAAASRLAAFGVGMLAMCLAESLAPTVIFLASLTGERFLNCLFENCWLGYYYTHNYFLNPASFLKQGMSGFLFKIAYLIIVQVHSIYDDCLHFF